MKCCICGNDIDVQCAPDGTVVWEGGHNAEPIVEDGRCCTMCNDTRVLPERMKAYFGRPAETGSE